MSIETDAIEPIRPNEEYHKSELKGSLSNIFKSKTFKMFCYVIFLSLPFVLMDLIVRFLTFEISYSQVRAIFPSIAFSIIWIALFVYSSLSLKGVWGRVVYGVCFGFFFVIFLTQVIYFPYTNFFFNFNLLNSADEGASYIWDVVKGIDWLTIVYLAVVLALGVAAIVFYPKRTRNHWIVFATGFVVFIILHIVVPKFYGAANTSLQWDNWRNPRNVYESFNDCNKNMKICGLYEYTFRDMYVTFLRPEEEMTDEEKTFLNGIYNNGTKHKDNRFTGIFEGKNVIFLQLEGIDNWLLNPDDMPNLYGMTKKSFVFNDHYSYYNGGGSTFNSELAVSTGFLTPISFVKNAYSFNSNSFPNSLPKKFKAKGYSANAFHMNTGEYYSRELNYKNWGYDNYYSLMSSDDYKDNSYQLDTEIIKNKTFYNKLFKQKGPFLHYIITYTPHTPFNFDSDVGKLIAKKVKGNKPLSEYTEEDVARAFATETDDMVGLLLKGLEDNGLLDNTVIVAFADHYLYTLNDKSILKKYKNTENNLINETPFFVWSNDMKKQEHVFKTNSQLDILPTVLNLFGMDFNNEHYIGRDILDPSYYGYAFFVDYSWYDGVHYVDCGEVVNGVEYDEEYINEINTAINTAIRQNDLTLKYDFLGKK